MNLFFIIVPCVDKQEQSLVEVQCWTATDRNATLGFLSTTGSHWKPTQWRTKPCFVYAFCLYDSFFFLKTSIVFFPFVCRSQLITRVGKSLIPKRLRHICSPNPVGLLSTRPTTTRNRRQDPLLKKGTNGSLYDSRCPATTCRGEFKARLLPCGWVFRTACCFFFV